MSDINTPMGVIVCPQCSLPKLAGVYGYAGPQCQCWHPTPQPTLDVAGTLLQQSEEIRRLRSELARHKEAGRDAERYQEVAKRFAAMKTSTSEIFLDCLGMDTSKAWKDFGELLDEDLRREVK